MTLFCLGAPGRASRPFVPTLGQWEALERGESLSGVSLVIRRAIDVGGRVTYPDGSPAKPDFVMLALDPQARSGFWEGLTDETDEGGVFEFRGIDPAADLHLYARLGKEFLSRAVPLSEVVEGGRPHEVELVLEPVGPVVLELRTTGFREGLTVLLDGYDRPVASTVSRYELQTGRHRLRIVEEVGSAVRPELIRELRFRNASRFIRWTAPDRDSGPTLRLLADVAFEIPEGLAVYTLDVEIPAEAPVPVPPGPG
ncbi:MAG: hypothetical protein GF328_09935 [Candidatus Latescibacteria bacterium]|nr:hypothetical protein [Candidatus Latescibacterota bacterium]